MARRTPLRTRASFCSVRTVYSRNLSNWPGHLWLGSGWSDEIWPFIVELGAYCQPQYKLEPNMVATGSGQPLTCSTLLQGTLPSCPGEAEECRAEHAQEAG